MSTIIDQVEDAPLKAIADLLEASIVAKWGRDALAPKATFTHEIQVSQLMNRLPALIVLRESDQAVADHDVIDDEITTVVLEYYLPPTPPDRMPLRRPMLRAIWKHMHARLCAGFDPLVTPHHVNVAPPDESERMVPALAAKGWAVPQRWPATAKYAVASAQEGIDPLPWFRAVVTMRTSALFDWTFGGTWDHDALLEIRTKVQHVPQDPDDDPEPGFDSDTKFPPRV